MLHAGWANNLGTGTSVGLLKPGLEPLSSYGTGHYLTAEPVQ